MGSFGKILSYLPVAVPSSGSSHWDVGSFDCPEEFWVEGLVHGGWVGGWGLSEAFRRGKRDPPWGGLVEVLGCYGNPVQAAFGQGSPWKGQWTWEL